MKNYLFVLGLLLFFVPTKAQLNFGIKGGINSTSIKPEELKIVDNESVKQFGVSVKDADYGMHFGFYLDGQIHKFFIRPEVVFNSNKVNYNVTEFGLNDIVTTVRSETYNYLDIPVMMGIDFGAVRLMGGPVGHVFIASRSELTNLSGYEQKFDDMSYGYQLGAGLQAGRFGLEGRFEGNFNNASDHFTFFDHDYAFSSSPTRFLVSLSFEL